MPRKTLLVTALSLFFSLPATAQTQGAATHLTVYDAGLAEFLEERTVELQTGVNRVEWRSLMPKAFVRTVRVVAEDSEVVRQDVTYDGPEVRSQRSPVLHLSIRNRGAAGPRKVQVDYLAPDMSWLNDYALVLEPPAAAGAPPEAATLGAWVTINNQTGTDVSAGTVDLVAGEISLLTGENALRRELELSRNTAQIASDEVSNFRVGGAAEAAPLSAFSRFRLGRDVAFASNAPFNRLPLFQRAPLKVTERNVFENEHNTQTLARGGFVLLPRGLEVRLVSRNPTDAAMPAGLVTVYAREGGPAQIVGQDRIPVTPPAGEFSVSQGRSSTLFGTRRVLERQQIEYKNQDGHARYRLVTRVEVVLTNRGPRAAEAFVREGLEPFAENRWIVLESSAPFDRLAANSVQARVQVPAGGSTTVTYTVETK